MRVKVDEGSGSGGEVAEGGTFARAEVNMEVWNRSGRRGSRREDGKERRRRREQEKVRGCWSWR